MSMSDRARSWLVIGGLIAFCIGVIALLYVLAP